MEKDMPGYTRRHNADVSCTKMAEPIEMPLGLWTLLDPRNRPKRSGNFGVKHMRLHSQGQSAVSCAKMAEPTEMPFGLCGLWAHARKHDVTWGAHSRHLANTIEKSMWGGDAAFLSNYVHHLLWPPYGIGQAIIFLPCDFYILSSYSSFFFPRLISAAADWMSTILPHMVWP